MDSPNNRTAGYLQRSCKTGKFQASTTSKQQTAMQGIHGWIDAKKRLIKSEKTRQARNGELRRTGEMSVAWIIEAALSLLSAGTHQSFCLHSDDTQVVQPFGVATKGEGETEPVRIAKLQACVSAVCRRVSQSLSVCCLIFYF